MDLSVLKLEMGVEGRMYLPILLYSCLIFGLLDCGATVSVIGGRGWEKLKRLGIKLTKTKFKAVRVANDQLCEIIGQVEVPVEVEGVTHLCSFQVVPNLNTELILGMDFWNLFEIVPSIVGKACSLTPLETAKVEELVVAHDDLDKKQVASLNELVDRFKPSLGRPELGRTSLVTHKIDTGDAEPVRQRFYPYSPKVMEHLNLGLDELLSQDVVEPSNSPWASRVLPIKKKDGRYRWVVDLRGVNKLTKSDAYPLPRVNTILDQLRDARYISSIDLKSAYFQVPLEESSKEKTAFIIPGRGLFQFKRMPQGLKTSAATWQRLIERVLGEDLKENVFVYLDDIIIVSKSFEHHLELLTKVFERLEKAGLTINMEKCQLCRSELTYLGYVVNKDGLHVDPEKVRAIAEFSRPSNVGGVRRFNGMASWYRRFVRGFSSIMGPLNALTSKNAKFIWTDECENAFRSIKEQLISSPVLTCPDFSKTFTLHCDASSYGLGAVLTQEDGVIAYASRSLTKAERKYSTTELECLAVLWAIEKFRCYLEGYYFEVITDHASLIWLDNLKEPCGRLSRWAVRLQQYDFKVIHRKGKEHEAPDALSRDPLLYEGESVDLITVEVESSDEWYEKMKSSIQDDPEGYPAWKVEGSQVFKLVTDCNGLPTWNRLVPKELRDTVLKECHDSPLAGHGGFAKTFDRVRQQYYWPKMGSDIKKHISKCHVCLLVKIPQFKPAGFMGKSKVVTAPFQTISSDIIGPLPKSSSGFLYMVVSVCLFTKYVWVRPLRRATAEAVRDHLLEDIFLKYSVPTTLVCDNGPQYKSKVIESLLNKFGVKMFCNFFYHPQTNPTERVNRVIKTMIISYVVDNQRLWDKQVHNVAHAINTARHESTGYSPHQLVYGERWCGYGTCRPGLEEDCPISFGDREELMGKWKDMVKVRTEVLKRLEIAYEKNCRTYNLRRREVELQVGQIVYRKNYTQSNAGKYYSAKLATKFVGPFKVVKKVGYRAYLLEAADGKRDGPWHVSDIKPVADGEQPDVDSLVMPSHSIKVCTWNVAGFRSIVKKGYWNSILNCDFDVICLQETKCNETVWETIPVPEGFTPHWFSGEKPGYCGVGILTRIRPQRVSFGFQDSSDVEARLITIWFEKFILVTIYAPYSGQWLGKLAKRVEWESKLSFHIQTLMSGGLPIVICGDFNVAASNWDVCASELRPYTAGATVTERFAFKQLLALGLVDVFRSHNPEIKDAFSFWRYGGTHRPDNKGWRLDYFLVSQCVLKNVSDIKIWSDLKGSDHCPVSISLQF